jgi:hypothetical protein
MEKNTTPVISVVLPVFNGEHYVTYAVQSILDQTWSDFELILLDDGSTDGTLQLLRSFEACDQRVVLVSRENRGLVATLNEGLELAQGQWIARMDADDIAFKDRFARQLQWLQRTGADICGTWVQFFGTSDHRILKHPVSDSAIKTALFFGSVFAHPSVIMRASLAKQLRYSKDWERCEDYDLWQRAALEKWTMTNLPEVLLMYRQHESQISTASSDVQQMLTQKIRQRHWDIMRSELGVEEVWAAELLKLRQAQPPAVDLEVINLALVALAQCSEDHESLEVVLDHAWRLYVRAAGRSQHLARHWEHLHARLGVKTRYMKVLQLLLLRLFRLGPGSQIFDSIKSIGLRHRVIKKGKPPALPG